MVRQRLNSKPHWYTARHAFVSQVNVNVNRQQFCYIERYFLVGGRVLFKIEKVLGTAEEAPDHISIVIHGLRVLQNIIQLLLIFFLHDDCARSTRNSLINSTSYIFFHLSEILTNVTGVVLPLVRFTRPSSLNLPPAF